MRNRMTALSLAFLLVLSIVGGCSNESPVDATNEAQAPELPSTSTMTMNLSLFESASIDMESQKAGMLDETSAAVYHTKLNFLNAAVRALFLQVVVYSALVEPVCAFEVAIRSVPQPQPDGSWLWTYIYVAKDAEYSIYLYGKPVDDYVEWRMEVSSTDAEMPLYHFTWFDGVVYNDEDSGYWQFYEPSDQAIAAFAYDDDYTPGIQTIRVDWENRARNESELVFLVNKPGIPEEGSTLTFLESCCQGSIDFYNAENDASGSILWYSDGSGSIEWPDYNDGMKSCWNNFQYDVDCPE